MVLAVVSVSGRNAMNAPLPGYVDWIEQAMPLIAFLGRLICGSAGRRAYSHGHRHLSAPWSGLVAVRADLGHSDPGSDAGTGVGQLVPFRPVLRFWSATVEQGQFHRHRYSPCGLPSCWRRLAFSVLCVRLVLQVWGYGRAFVLGLESPVAVPLIQDAAAQAAAEAEQFEGQD